MDDQPIRQVAGLLRERDVIDAKIAQVTGRPVAAGELGKWIASQVFDIQLERSATASGIGGRFRSGHLRGRTVNVLWYMKHQGLLDTSESAALDYYLVLTGPPSQARSPSGITEPWCIDSVYLFDARRLRSEQESYGVKPGTASSLTKSQWRAAEVYPSCRNPLFLVMPNQAALLQLFLLTEGTARPASGSSARRRVGRKEDGGTTPVSAQPRAGATAEYGGHAPMPRTCPDGSVNVRNPHQRP